MSEKSVENKERFLYILFMPKYKKNIFFIIFILLGELALLWCKPIFLNKLFEQPISVKDIVVDADSKYLCLKFKNYKYCSPLIYKTKTTFKIKIGNMVKTFVLSADKKTYELVQNSEKMADRGKRVAVLYIATGRYITFWDGFYHSAEDRLLPNHNKTYFLFTDADITVPQNVVLINQKQEPWPYITLKRYHFFTQIADKLEDFDYIYFFNANTRFTSTIDEEIFPTEEQEIMVAIHPHYYRANPHRYTYDHNPKSKAFIPKGKGKYYVMGAFNGGTAKGFLKMAQLIKKWTDEDLKNNVIPLWHDESMLNRYVHERQLSQKPVLILLPEYLYPDNMSEIGEFLPYKKIQILDKNRYGGHKWLRAVVDTPEPIKYAK